jgi:hypothetical protein
MARSRLVTPRGGKTNRMIRVLLPCLPFYVFVAMSEYIITTLQSYFNFCPEGLPLFEKLALQTMDTAYRRAARGRRLICCPSIRSPTRAHIGTYQQHQWILGALHPCLDGKHPVSGLALANHVKRAKIRPV